MQCNTVMVFKTKLIKLSLSLTGDFMIAMLEIEIEFEWQVGFYFA